MTRRFGVIAAAATAVVISGCTPTTGTVAGGDASTVSVAASTSAPVTGADRSWVSVTGQGAVTMSNFGTQYGPVAAPGLVITRAVTLPGAASAKGDKCTIGPAVTSGTRRGFITAGHCADNGSSVEGTQQWWYADRAAENPIQLGVTTDAQDNDTTVDSAVIWSSAPIPNRIAGTWPVAGVLTPAAAQRLKVGDATPVCVDGAVSGVRCGSLTRADGQDIRFSVTTQSGDSGAPVFLVDSDGRAHLVGVLQGISNSSSNAIATYLEPVLARLGAKAAVDPAAHAAVVGDGGYSSQVAPAA